MSNPRVIDRLNRRLDGASIPRFELRLEDGSVHSFGDSPQPAFRITIHTQNGTQALTSLDEATIGLAYLDGDLDIEGDFLRVFDLRKHLSDSHPIESLSRFLLPLIRGQFYSDRRWIPQHYDHGTEFYFAFLDREFHLYSQALYTSEGDTLEQAVCNKLKYILDICRIGPGCEVLDVGAGWGAFEKYAGSQGISVTMLTLSPDQFRRLNDWCSRHELPCQLRVEQESIYAHAPGQRYDAIVLLGVMEHLPNYRSLFARFEQLLKPGGRVYMDFSANTKRFQVSTFTRRYVFPGNHTPVVVSDLLAAANHSAFEPIVLHNDRHSYFLTLQQWARNLEAAHDLLAPEFGERTYRLFQLYLWGGAHQLQRDGRMESYRAVFQRSRGFASDEIGVYRAV